MPLFHTQIPAFCLPTKFSSRKVLLEEEKTRGSRSQLVVVASYIQSYIMPCPPMDATTSSVAAIATNVKKKMAKAADTKKPSRSSSSSSSSSSWFARSMGFYHPSSSTSSSSKNRAQQPPPDDEAKNIINNNNNNGKQQSNNASSKKKKRMNVTCAGSSICSTKQSSVMTRDNNADRGRSASSRSLKAPNIDVVYAAAISATSSFNSDTTTASSAATTVTTSSSSSFSPLSSPISSSIGTRTSSFRGGMQIKKLSGCYQCHSVFDPSSFTFSATFPCTDCDEVFSKAESLELHRATRHAVSELGSDDTSRNIVEIIFQSSWLRKQQQEAHPVCCKIERILKVQSSERTVKRFEQYKESIREKANSGEGKKNNARCVADGNELLRFHCTTFTCSLGVDGGTALCRSPAAATAQCKLCSIIRDGFRVDGDGKIATMATSGRAHDTAQVVSDSEKRAMLVCRVVAGRVKKASDDKSSEEDCDCDFDSVSPCPSTEGVYSDLDELFVFNPRAILPCFVVIYSGY